MLAFLGFLTVVLMLVLILAKKLTPTVALISVPLVTGLIACGFLVTDPENAPGQVDFWANVQSLSGMVTGADGIGSVAATGVMFLFSILFFGGIMGPAGMIIGVPTFAVIYRLVAEFVEKRLAARELSTATEDYGDLDYIDEKKKTYIR